jgi:MoaA/NifB/PqqE/SkfB family radical SAM enzyme
MLPSMPLPAPTEIARRRLNRLTHRLSTLPILVLMPHSRCNCRCVMCDIWKANRAGQELSVEDLAPHLAALQRLHVRRVVLSGGEALMHSNLWSLCALLKDLDVKITLLSTGLLLQRHASDIIRWCDDVTVSLDGSRDVHDSIRNIPHAYDRLAVGVAALKTLKPSLRITARCVLQRRNFLDLPNIVAAAHSLGLDQISFLAADVSSTAFNRPMAWGEERSADVSLTAVEVEAFRNMVETTIQQHPADFASGFIAEDAEKLRRLPRYYAALNGDGDFPAVTCNAPWVSTVIEADGSVRPCFFHRTLGNIHEQPLEQILNAPDAVAFRRQLDTRQDPICRRCVCTLQLGSRTPV